jgi:hypothetical protein
MDQVVGQALATFRRIQEDVPNANGVVPALQDETSLVA